MADGGEQAADLAVQMLIGPAHGFDLIDRVQHGGVMFAEVLSDLRQRCGSQVPGEIHCNLAGVDNCFDVRPHLESLTPQAKLLGDAPLDQLDGGLLIFSHLLSNFPLPPFPTRFV